jgi:DNA-directed RNA polymerase subunit RPC12/RpoP
MTDDKSTQRVCLSKMEQLGREIASLEAKDLRIRSGAPSAEMPAAVPPPDGRRPWLAAAQILGLILTSSVALGVWLAVRHSRAARTPGTAFAPDGEAKPDATSSVSFPCSRCGKQLKARPELAGKKLRCPGCGEPVVVPGP